jgi:RNA polymerase sigma factor (sigma-70 family)
MPRRIRVSVNVVGSGCSALADASVSRGVTVVSDAPAVEDRTAKRILEDVHARTGQQLFGFARRLGLTDDEAEEVVQEALLRLWRALRGRTIIDDPAAWTFRATYRLAMDRHRGRRRWQAFLAAVRPTSSEAEGRAAMSAVRDELLSVWSEVDRLPARQRHVVYLHYHADLSFETIGRVLGIRASSARADASRGVATLRERLAGGDE